MYVALLLNTRHYKSCWRYNSGQKSQVSCPYEDDTLVRETDKLITLNKNKCFKEI